MSERRLPDYDWASSDPAALDLPTVPAPPLQRQELRAGGPPEVTHDCGEGLVVLDHPRVRALQCYWLEGLTSAQPLAWLRSGVADALYDAAERLPSRFGLAVFDAWRPLELQAEIFELAYADDDLPAGFVSPPSRDPRTPPPHLTGGALDATLSFEGVALSLGTNFDDFSPLAATDAFEAVPGVVRDLRRLLHSVMRGAGFVELAEEWWHFELGTRHWASHTGEPPRYGPAATPPAPL